MDLTGIIPEYSWRDCYTSFENITVKVFDVCSDSCQLYGCENDFKIYTSEIIENAIPFFLAISIFYVIGVITLFFVNQKLEEIASEPREMQPLKQSED